jgi:hypothetical protein
MVISVQPRELNQRQFDLETKATSSIPGEEEKNWFYCIRQKE